MGTNNNIEIFKKYKNESSLFLETGSYIGDGIQAAIDAGFKEIISIEISEYYYQYCKNRFGQKDNLQIIHGDTRKLMNNILAQNSPRHKKIFFWLDAHNSGGMTGGDDVAITLLEEVRVISNYAKDNKLKAILCMDDINDTIKELIDNNSLLKFVSQELCIDQSINAISENYIVIYEANYAK